MPPRKTAQLNDADTTPEEEETIVQVKASAKRRRAGMSFAKDETKSVDWDSLTEDQRNSIENDPVLHITK